MAANKSSCSSSINEQDEMLDSPASKATQGELFPENSPMKQGGESNTARPSPRKTELNDELAANKKGKTRCKQLHYTFSN
ncbi:hypothetical protein Tsubulata_007157 [Turnera subulata]|uniref:Uncharacterized protein n=1 Tax=Turnera subulata TaxID=218843 RepID=A0A9Q0FCZ0_9ROSI|nr:hypothetical protein Tsubulata_007157 [Turnera subulata]